MKLKRIFIEHFKGIEKLEIKADGKNLTIRGENGAGKTTVADAYSWAVFGKGFDGKTIETQIKKRDEHGNTPNDGGVEHTVEVELERDDGRPVVLKRKYVEDWHKKRGTAESEFTGHSTHYFIDDVPMQKKDYEAQISMLCSEDAFKLLSMPLHFCTNLPWKDRRKILMDMCGDVSDADVISSNSELTPLEKLLDGKTIADLRKVIAAKIKKTNEELKNIPARIDELTNTIPEAGGQTLEALQVELESLERQKAEKQKQVLRIENGGEVAERQKEAAKVEAEMTKFKAGFDAKYASKVSADASAVNSYRLEVERIGKEIENIEKRKKIVEGTILAADKKKDLLREKWRQENETEFSTDISDTCPTCGQKLPAEKVEAARKKAIEDFNIKKSETLANINSEGKKIAEQQNIDKEMLKGFVDDIDSKTKRLTDLSDLIADASKKVEAVEKPDIKEQPEYASLASQLTQINREIEDLRAGNQTELQKAKQDVALFAPDISSRQEKIAAIKQSESIKGRIKELEAREKELGDIYSDLQKQLFLTEEFMRSKVEATEESINSHFKYVRFKMFSEKINGALDECCEPLIDGVPFNDGLNKGNRMKAAIDILNALSDYYKQSLPVFIDDCESYTSLIPVNSQLIKLIADGKYKKLNVEIEEE